MDFEITHTFGIYDFEVNSTLPLEPEPAVRQEWV